jgi:TP901 family phage tail tape measure protein
MNDNFKIFLQAIIDDSSLTKVQKDLAKKKLEIQADIDFSNFAKSKADIEKQFRALSGIIKDILGDAVSDKQATQWVKQYYKEIESGAKQAVKEQEKLVNAMAKGRESSEQARQAEEKRHQLAQDKAVNKALEEEYNLRQRIADKSKEIQLSIDNGHGASEYQNRINRLILDFERYGVTAEKARETTDALQITFDKMKNLSGVDLIEQSEKFEQEFKAVKTSIEQAKLSYDKFMQPVSDEKVSSLIVKIQNYLNKNTAITKEAQVQLEKYVTELKGGNISLSRWNEINNELSKTDSLMRSLGKLGKSFKDQFAQAANSFAQWISVSSLIMTGVHETKEAISDLKELDDILTEISKTSDLTKTQLQELGSTAFEKASDLGKDATDYLSGVMEMSRSGYYGDKGESMARTSLLAQAAGDMTAELANKYVLATNAAYKYNGEAEKLNAVLDGQNSITNRNSVAMADMATAMTEAGTVASSYRVSIEDLSAMIGTIESVTKLGGSEVGTGIKSLLINLQNISSSKIVGTLDDANASMTEMVNGVEQLRDPISILRDLAKTFNELDEADPMRAKILTNIGGKYQATKLAALLQNMDMFDKMLVDYSEGAESALTEAEKSATNLTGSLNRLGNTWDSIVNNVMNANELTGIVNVLNSLLKGVNSVTGALGTLGTTGATLGAILGAKNVGGSKMYDPHNHCHLWNLPTNVSVLLDTIVFLH